MEERRKYKRVRKPFSINILSCDKDGQILRFDKIRNNPKFCDESGVDFTPEGIKIMCSKSLPETSRIRLKMLIPFEDDLTIIRAKGNIRWSKEVEGQYKRYFHMGIQFSDLEEQDRLKLTDIWQKYS